MAYLGVIGVQDRLSRIAWVRTIIAVDVLSATIGLYAGNGGYIYVS